MLWRICAFAALGGFLFGYDLGVMGGALLGISDELAISEWAQGLIVGAAKLGACFGAFLGGALMLHYGRRIAITIDSVLFMLGPIVMATAAGTTGLVLGRLLVGLGIGVSAVVVPAYLGEVAPAPARGTIVELYEVLLCAGMLSAALVDWGLSSLPGAWRWMVAMPLAPALLMSAALFLLPESPRWLVVNGRLDEALSVIQRILTGSTLPNGSRTSTADAERELMELWSAVEKDKEAARERALAARRAQFARLRHQGLKRQPGHRKQQFQSLSSIEPAAARGSHSRQPSVEALVAADGAQSVQLTTFRRLSTASTEKRGVHKSKAMQDQDAESERQPLVGPDHTDSTAQPTPADLQTGQHTPPLPPQQHQHDALAASNSMSPPEMSSARQELDIPFGRPPLAAADILPGEVSPSSQQEAPGTPDLAGSHPFSAAATAAASMPESATQAAPQLASLHASDAPAGADAGAGPLSAMALSTAKSDALSSGGSSAADGNSRSQGSQQAAPDLVEQRSLSLRTVRTAPSEGAAQDDSPVVWFDEEGTPMFHKSLSQVPAGLTPIRTRSSDHEADMFNVHSMRVPPSPVPVDHGSGSNMAPPYGPESFWGAFHHMMLDVGFVSRGPEKAAFWMAIWLAFFNQACASTTIINYAPSLLEISGMQRHGDSILYSSGVGIGKVIGVLIAMLLVDTVGRRPLLLFGSSITAIAMLVVAAGDAMGSWLLQLAAMCAFMLAFSMSWAGIFWVLLSELFSMSVKSPALAAAMAALFLTGAVSDLVFLGLLHMFGASTFILFGAISAAGGVYVYRNVPETKGENLQEVQALMKALHPDADQDVQQGAPPSFHLAMLAHRDVERSIP